MYKEQLIRWLEAQGKSYKIRGKEIQCQCLNPEHDDRSPSFSINWVTGSCFCFSCTFKSHANRILNIKQDDDTLRLSKYLSLNRLWEDQDTEDEPPVSITLPPVDFLINESIRGVPKELLKELGVYYCSIGRYRGRLIFPIRDYKGNLLGFDARIYEHPDRPEVLPSPETKHAKYLRPTAMKTANVLYPLDYVYNHRDDLDTSTVAIVEGVFDAISYLALGVPALCNFGLGAPSAQKAGYLLAMGVQGLANGLDAEDKAIKAWQGDPEKGKEGLKDAWRKFLPIAKPLPLTLAIRASGYKDASEYLEGITKC